LIRSGPVAGFLEHNDASSDFIRGGDSFEQLSDYWLFKTGSASWSSFSQFYHADTPGKSTRSRDCLNKLGYFFRSPLSTREDVLGLQVVLR
jgi:hypothetical protein